MAQIIPFRGTLYDPRSSVGSIRNVVAPPYDIIDAAGQKALHDRHPQNIIRLELGMDEPGDDATNNRYTRAAETLGSWIARGALKRDAQPALYYHTIEYAPPSSDARAPKKTLRGFLTTTKLEPLDSGHIYPHENTRSAAKTDRLNLLKVMQGESQSDLAALFGSPECDSGPARKGRQGPARSDRFRGRQWLPAATVGGDRSIRPSANRWTS